MALRRVLAVFILCVAAFAQAPLGAVGHVTVKGTLTIGGAESGVTLLSVAVTPATTTAALGVPVSYAATGTFSDGTTADVTAQAIWFATPPSDTTNVGNVFTCMASGTVTVDAQVSGVLGTATLICQAVQITPSGNLGSGIQNQIYQQQFTGSGGTPPYLFSSVDLPAWASLSGTGLLSGTPPTITVYNFHVTAIDALLNTSGAVAMSINVQAPSAEDNTYCLLGDIVTGLFQDGPAGPLQNCNYTAIASTPTAVSPTIFVCPANQNLADGVTPNVPCVVGAPPYYNTVQGALNAANCGDWVAIYANNYIGPTQPQNVYDESLILPHTSCFGDPHGWIWVSTGSYLFLPAPGTRINPSWVLQTSIPGRPAYPQSGQGIPRLPEIRCVMGSNSCGALKTPHDSAGASGWRFIGIEFTSPHGREAVCPLNFNGTPQCSPGASDAIVSIGCSDYSVQKCGATGATHIILDRIIVHACDDKSDITCLDQQVNGVEMQGGQHLSLIDSFIYGSKTLGDNHGTVGPTTESHGILTGNVRNTLDDIAVKIVNNFVEGSSVSCVFSGGGSATPGLFPYDTELRRNHCFKPLLWKVDDPSFPLQGGSVHDAWITARGSGYPTTPGATTCSIDAPTGSSPIQATCHAIVGTSGANFGKVRDVIIDNPGRGYIVYPKFAFGRPAPAPVSAPSLVLNTTGGFLVNGHTIFVTITFVQTGTGSESSPPTDSSGKTITSSKAVSGCSGGNLCSVTVTAPVLPPGFSGYSVYSCDTTGSSCPPLLQTALNNCQNIIGNCVIQVGGVGSGLAADAKATGLVGIFNVKNHIEFKFGRRVLIEGNVAENCWKGQSDQDCNIFLLTPKNANQTCTQCTDQDFTVRYNFFRNSNRGGFIGTDIATQCNGGGVCLPDTIAGISIHDDIWDNVNPVAWISKGSAFDGFGGTIFGINNANPQNKAIHDVTINHVTAITTAVRASTFASAMNINFNCLQTSAIPPGITMMNSILAGGVKATGQVSHGCFQCSGPGCSGGTVTALNSALISDNLLPVDIGGNYTTNQVVSGVVDNPGTCTVVPTSCSFSGGGGSAAVCKLQTSGGTVTNVFPDSVGHGYTSAPAVVFSGQTCSVTPTAHAVVGGATIARSEAWCNDHNLYPTAAFAGEVPMTPYPTSQGADMTHSSCPSPGGGGNVGVSTWNDVHFVNFMMDGAGNEIPTGDLHLDPSSPGHLAANDGRDMGADVDQVLLKTGCVISGGVMTCP